MIDRLKHWARALKREIGTAWLAARDPRVPLAAQLLCVIVAAYALSPVDLIPDFIPVLGLLDDLILVPAGLWLALRLVPAPLLAELRDRAAQAAWPGASRAGAAAVIALWALALGGLFLVLTK